MLEVTYQPLTQTFGKDVLSPLRFGRQSANTISRLSPISSGWFCSVTSRM
ncbi:hypothetical protein SAMN04490188_2750 [Pseudomonas kilonensis]|uniref:Uncharacterized protein n=1 Tax=Pseudomonas kilonensis TaxID=132476 RepID=A0ABY0YZR8_9PSED|nr:hypothetical protein SAMN04490188_2750 [Pseudomonas kilonensis]